MGFGSHFRHALHHVVRGVVNPVAGLKEQANLSKKVTKVLHPVTTAIGKADATIYTGLLGGIVGAKKLAGSGSSHDKVFGGSATKVGEGLVKIEKPLAAIGGGLVAGGVGSSLANAATNEIAPGDGPAAFRDGSAGGAPSGDHVVEAGTASSDSGMGLLFLLAAGLLLALKKG